MTFAWFNESVSPTTVGAKGYGLGVMARSGLPVPPGFCVPVDDLNSLCLPEIEDALAQLPAVSVAVRSSGIGEDSVRASFAGIHVTRLGIRTPERVRDALLDIRESSIAPAAMAYRRRLGLAEIPRMAAVVQKFIDAEAGGVLFMRDPIDGSNRVVIEASWGLGESVVAGTVTPDRWTFSSAGALIHSEISDKDTAIVAGVDGVVEIEVDESRRRLPCLSAEDLSELLRLASECEKLFGEPQDVEWAKSGGILWILQSRPITGTASDSPRN